MVLVALGTEAEAAPFFAHAWPGARVICDPERRLYEGFGFVRGSLGQLLGPAVWLAGIRAFLAGHRAGRPGRDVRQLSGAVLVDGGTVRWRHASRTSADLPDFDAIGRAP